MLKQTGKTGARRKYCDNRCRRRAQDARDRARRAPALPATSEQSSAIASDIQGLAQQLLDGERRHAPLEVRFKLSKLLNREIRCYLAAAVQEERAAGEGWAAIGEAAGIPAASARASWNEAKVAAILTSRPARSAFRGVLPQTLGAERTLDWAFARPSGRLQRAAARVMRTYLTGLAETGPISVDDVAVQAGLPRDAVALGVGGELIASWPVTYMLAALLGGQPGILRTAWEAASGELVLDEQPAAEVKRYVGEMLRVLHVAAGEPETETLSALAHLDQDAVADALVGTRIPDWSGTERLAASLGAEPSIVQPFWQCWSMAEVVDEVRHHVA
ncbi:hypothetical protein AB0O32_30440 [Streptomyces rubiginosohelvolus]|uniref:hypothetical protein n=1 Tax=Streptomyces rubiginosohelvolus TaxID=67362 RepID=UPI0034282A76